MNEVMFIKDAFMKAGIEVKSGFHLGELVHKPDQQGCCTGDELGVVEPGWYLYEFDEHCMGTAHGPFRKEAIIYAAALKLGVSHQMSEYRFTEADRETYIHKVIHLR